MKIRGNFTAPNGTRDNAVKTLVPYAGIVPIRFKGYNLRPEPKFRTPRIIFDH